MIKFSSEAVRTAFHSLPLDKQREWQMIAERFLAKGKSLTIHFIEMDSHGRLEASIRIDDEFNPSVA